mmetsp:Transcript_20647/g.45269  ORF Transcript_20647/g.45269 Transcript_20647/m.45269 type:complete len:248 (-) Transcript_20647:338-1081(-)
MLCQSSGGSGASASSLERPEEWVRALGSVCQKTRLCAFHIRGACSRGQACSFAHGQEELRPLPDLRQTRWCPTLMRHGRCDGGTGCRFAHTVEELRGVPEVAVIPGRRPYHNQERRDTRRYRGRGGATSGGAEVPRHGRGAWPAEKPLAEAEDPPSRWAPDADQDSSSQRSTELSDTSIHSLSRRTTVESEMSDVFAAESDAWAANSGPWTRSGAQMVVKHTFIHLYPSGGNERRRAQSVDSHLTYG